MIENLSKASPSSVPIRIALASLVLLFVQLACGAGATPAPTVPGTEAPAATYLAPTAVTIEGALAQVDRQLEQTMSAAITYNVPSSMNVEETKTIQLLISPSLSANELKGQLNEPGTVITATVSVTPRMRAELRGADPDAFTIQPLHDNPEQLLSNVEPTEWRWTIKAEKAGVQELTLTLYRLIEFGNKEYWRQVTYENSVTVNVTLAQRLANFNWEWLVGILLTGILIPALWRVIDKRQKSRPKAKK